MNNNEDNLLEYLYCTVEKNGFLQQPSIVAKLSSYKTKEMKGAKQKNSITEDLEILYGSKKAYLYARLLQDYLDFRMIKKPTFEDELIWKKFNSFPKPFLMSKKFLDQVKSAADNGKAEILTAILEILGIIVGLYETVGKIKTIDYQSNSIGPFTYSSYAYIPNCGFLVQRNLIARTCGLHSLVNDRNNFRVSYQWESIPIRFVSIEGNCSVEKLRSAVKKDSKYLYIKTLKKLEKTEKFLTQEIAARIIHVKSEEEKNRIISNILRKNEKGLPGLSTKVLKKKKGDGDEEEEVEEKVDDQAKELEVEKIKLSGLIDRLEEKKDEVSKIKIIPLFFSSDGQKVKAIPNQFIVEFVSILVPAPEICSIANMAFMYKSYQDNELYVNTIFEKLDSIEEKFNRSLIANGRNESVLSPQEVEILKLPSNILLLGRSGTGKTTCALLRLYAQSSLQYSESFMDLRSDNDSSNNNTLFISLSPVLCSQAKKFYRKFMEEKEVLSKNTKNIIVDDEEDAPLTIEEQEEELDTLPNSLAQLTPEDSPSFLTFRRFLYMLDATLDQPFFARDENKNLLGADKSSTWHGEGGGLMKIVSRKYVPIDERAEDIMGDDSDDEINYHDFDDSDDDDDVKAARGELQIEEQSRSSYEIDYKFFSEFIGNRYEIHPSLIWTEIQSYIKGSVESLLSPNGYLTLEQYMLIGRTRTLISMGKRKQIYEAFEFYEKYKSGYDMQDLVYHIYTRIKHEGYRGVMMRNVFVDEVQDFTQSALQLIMEVCPYQSGFFFTGDTCQTIARGVGFRFSELKTLFHFRKNNASFFSDYYTVPSVQQLTYNFRSHSRLIDLGTSVVKLLEILFPTSIDILATDQSKIDGPIPLVMNFASEGELFQFLFGNTKNREEVDMQFGAQQVVIVRDQESKNNLPIILQHALCMTVYEAKGLEFEDVILYNFFADSPCSNEWCILNAFANVETISSYKENKSEAGIAKLNLLELDKDIQELVDSAPSSSKKYLQTVHFNHSHHSLLCSELKHLYVALTRAKKNLYIFDQAIEKMFPILRYWKNSNLVKIVKLNDSEQMGIAAKTTPEEWRKQGINMLRNSYFTQAKHCFSQSGDRDLYLRADAFYTANEAALLLKKINHPTVWTFEGSGIDPWINPAKLLLEQEKIAFDMFANAAKIFESIGCVKYAARCYSSRKDYKIAAELYFNAGQFRDAALNFIDAEDFEKAGDCYAISGDVVNAISAYERVDCYPKIIEFIASRNNSEEFHYITTYIKRALQVLVMDPVNPLPLKEQIDYARIHLFPNLKVDFEEIMYNIDALKQFLDHFDKYDLYEVGIRVIIESNIPQNFKSTMVRERVFRAVLLLSQQYWSTKKEKKNRRKVISTQIIDISKYLNDLIEIKQLLLPLALWKEAAILLESFDLKESITIYEQHYSYLRIFPLYKELIASHKDTVEATKFKIDLINCYIKRILQLTFDIKNGFPSRSNWQKQNIQRYFEEIDGLLLNATDIQQYHFLHPETPTINAVNLLKAIRDADNQSVAEISLKFPTYSHYRLIAYIHLKPTLEKKTVEPLIILLSYLKSFSSMLSATSLLWNDLRRNRLSFTEIYQLFQIESPPFDSLSFNSVVLPINHYLLHDQIGVHRFDSDDQFKTLSLGRLNQLLSTQLTVFILQEFQSLWKSKGASNNFPFINSLFIQNYHLIHRFVKLSGYQSSFEELKKLFRSTTIPRVRKAPNALTSNSLLLSYFTDSTLSSSEASFEIMHNLQAIDKEVVWTEFYRKFGASNQSFRMSERIRKFDQLLDDGHIIKAGDYFFDHCSDLFNPLERLVVISLATYSIEKNTCAILPSNLIEKYLQNDIIDRFRFPSDVDALMKLIYDLFEFCASKLDHDHHEDYFKLNLLISLTTPIPDYEYDEELIVKLESYVDSLNYEISSLQYSRLLTGESIDSELIIDYLADDYEEEFERFQSTAKPNYSENQFDKLPIERAARITSSIIITRSMKKLTHRRRLLMRDLDLASLSDLLAFDHFSSFYQLIVLTKASTAPQFDRRLIVFAKSLSSIHFTSSRIYRLISSPNVELPSEKFDAFFDYIFTLNHLKKKIWDDVNAENFMDEVTFNSLLSSLTSISSNVAHLASEIESANKNSSNIIDVEEKRQKDLIKAKLKKRGKKKQSKLQRKKDWIKHRFV